MMNIEEIAKNNNCNVNCVKCGRCAYFGYNNHKVMTNTGKSKCLKRKENTYYTNYCKKFKKQLTND